MATATAKPVSQWSREQKVEAAIRRALPLMPASAAQVIESMLTPQALATMAGVLVLWAGSHFVGVGEIADAVLLVVGVVALGWAAVDAAGELVAFAKISLGAQTEADLDKAAGHFARAVSLIGVEAVLALLLRGRPKTFKKPNVALGPAPRRGRIRYKPRTTGDPHMPAGVGSTSWWGDIRYSVRGSVQDQKLALLHERVHRALTPRLYFLRNIRVRVAANAYEKSYLLKYLEEAIAETVAQVGVNGVRSGLRGVTFPVKNGYVTLAEMGREVQGILLGPINVGGIAYSAYYAANRPSEYDER
jgi:hypothetical protein